MSLRYAGKIGAFSTVRVPVTPGGCCYSFQEEDDREWAHSAPDQHVWVCERPAIEENASDYEPRCILHSLHKEKDFRAFIAEIRAIIVEANAELGIRPPGWGSDDDDDIFGGEPEESEEDDQNDRTSLDQEGSLTETNSDNPSHPEDYNHKAESHSDTKDDSLESNASEEDGDKPDPNSEADEDSAFEDNDYQTAKPSGLIDLRGVVFPSNGFPGWHFTFDGPVDLQEARFYGRQRCFSFFKSWVDFSAVIVEGRLDLSSAIFQGKVWFERCIFVSDEVPDATTFIEPRPVLDLSKTLFHSEVSFRHSTFSGDVKFDRTRWKGLVEFAHSRFTSKVEFVGESALAVDRSWIEVGRPSEPSGFLLTMNDVTFERPELVSFRQCQMAVAFCNTDVSSIHFSDVRWSTRSELGGHGSRFAVLDEFINYKYVPSLFLADDPPRRNLTLIAQTYQQLRKSYEERADYAVAGHWHFGEMEMQRQSAAFSNPKAQWVYERLSVAAWYRRFSEYGESYTRPLKWLAGSVFAFALTYPIAGLHHVNASGQDETVSYRSAAQHLLARPAQNIGAPNGIASKTRTALSRGTKVLANAEIHGVLLHSAVTAISVAALEKDLEYHPVYPSGTLLMTSERVLSTLLLALTGLALRRRFKR